MKDAHTQVVTWSHIQVQAVSSSCGQRLICFLFTIWCERYSLLRVMGMTHDPLQGTDEDDSSLSITYVYGPEEEDA